MQITLLRRLRHLSRHRVARAGCGLVLLLSLAGGARTFPQWWQARLITKARGYLARGDARGAFLCAREALNRDTTCIPAVELMAQLAARSHSPEEIFWCQRLVTLRPHDAACRLQLADAALRNGETFVAAHALDGVTAPDQSFRYHGVAASLALATGQLRPALDHFEEAHRLRPDDGQTLLMLERVRLAAPEPEARALAHARLLELTSVFASRLEASRLLLAEARAQGTLTEAMRRAQALRDLPEAEMSDRLAYLEELDRSPSPSPVGDLEPHKFENELARLENASRFDESSSFALGSWLNSHHHANETREWLGKLPASLRDLPFNTLIEAEAMAELGDWTELAERLSLGHWGALDYLRLAYLARAGLQRTGARDAAFSETWQQAVQAAATDRGKIKILAGLTERWEWSAESKTLWWVLANDPNASLASLQHLYTLCRKRGATDELLRVSERIYQLDPGDLIARNNFAQLSMLLGRASPETHRIASENAERHPGDWALISTYAFSLHLQGRDHEALAHLLGLPGNPKNDPQMAAYFGVLYAATGQPESARPLLELAAGADLLPQEARLVREALTP